MPADTGMVCAPPVNRNVKSFHRRLGETVSDWEEVAGTLGNICNDFGLR